MSVPHIICPQCCHVMRNLQVSWQCAAHTSEVPDWWFACSIACPGHPFWLRVCVGRRNAIWRNAHSRSPGSAGRTRRQAAVSSSWLATCRGGGHATSSIALRFGFEVFNPRGIGRACARSWTTVRVADASQCSMGRTSCRWCRGGRCWAAGITAGFR